MRMVLSETTSIKACINELSQQATWPKGRKMCTGAEKLRFILFDILFNLFDLYLIFYC